MEVQNAPVTQGIDINVGDVQNMPLEQIAPKYEEMSNKFNEMGQNIVRDIAGRQRQLIGNAFSTPGEGMMGDYNENTYITPAVTNAQSSIRQIGASVALQEGMRRGEEAAKKRLKDAQDKYNKWVKEMNRRAAAAAEAQRAAAQKAAQQQRVAQSQIDPEYLKKKGLTADDFVSMSAAQKEQFYKDYYDSKIGVNWGDKNKWNEVKNQVYNALGASQDQRQDKSTGNQSQASKDFWASKAATDKFHEIWYSSYGDGKQIYQGRGTFVTKMKEAVNTFFNPQTPEQRKASFDQILKTVSLEIPALKKVQESTAGDRETEMRRYDQMNRDMARKNLSSDEVREMNREYLKVYKGQNDTQRLSELLNKAGAANPTKAHNKVVSVDKSVVTPAQLLESLFGLDKGELESLRKFKLEEPDKFNRVTNEIMDIRMGDFVHYSDGNPDNMDNYRFNKETNSFDLAPAGTTIVKVAPGAQEDADLKDVMNLYKDPILLKKIRENPDSEEAKQYSKKLNKFAKTQSDSLMAGAMYDTVTGSSLYNALKYDPSNNEDKKMNIRGKKISEYLKEFNSLSNEDFSKRVRELLTLANSERGFFLDKEGNKLSMNRADGAPLIGGKGNLDFSPEEAAALFTVIKKEAEAGNMRDQRFGAGEGTDLEVVERTAKNFRNSMKLAEGAANVIGAFFTIPFSNVSQGFQNNARKAFGEMGEAKKGEWGYGVDLRTSQYDAFRNLMEMQHSTKNGWLGQGTDVWTDVKRGVGEGVAFVADMVAPTVAFGAAKSLAVAAGKSMAQRATVQIAEKVAKQMAEKAGLSFERAAISNADDVIENVGKTLTKDGYRPISEVKAPQEALERVTGGVLKGRSDDMAEKISKESISTKSTSEFIETGTKPAVTKGLAHDDPLWGSINKVSQDVARITTQRGDVMKYLKNYDHKIFGYKTREELFQDIDKATKGIAFRNAAAKKQYVGALKNRVDLLRQSFGEHTALMTAGIRAESIANASPSAIRAAVQILSGREGFFTIKKVSEATTRAGMSMARTARKLGQDTDTWKAFAQRKDLAEKLINKAAAMGNNGKKMGTSDVLRFMAKEVGDKGARYRIFAQRFLKNEAIGNAMWAQYELKNSPENLSSADYIMQNVVGGTAISMAMTGLGGAWLRRNISKTNTQLQKQAEILSRNAQDVTSPAYQKAANKITELHSRAQMLADKSMDMSHSNYVVAEARKAADDAKATIQEHLASLSDTEFGKIAKKATAHSGKAVKDKLNATMPYSYRMMNALSSMRAAAGVRWAQYSKELPNLFALDAKASAKITAEVYEKAIRGASFEEKRKIAIDTVADNLVAMRGISKPVAKREAEYLFSEYDNMWARAEKSGIDIKSYGGDKRAVYLSPAGITSIKGEAPDAYLGLATKRKITSEVSNPVIERADDHGKAARSFLETGKTSVEGGISVTNPDGFNLVVSLNAYANRLESKMSLESIENNVLKNGDIVIKGEKNLTAAVEADKVYYKDLVDVEKASMEGYEDEIKEITSKQKALAGKVGDAHITNMVEKVEQLNRKIEDLGNESIGAGKVRFTTVDWIEKSDGKRAYHRGSIDLEVSKADKWADNNLVYAIGETLANNGTSRLNGFDVSDVKFVLNFAKKEFAKSKQAILQGKEPAGWTKRYLNESGDYSPERLAGFFNETQYRVKRMHPGAREAFYKEMNKDPEAALTSLIYDRNAKGFEYSKLEKAFINRDMLGNEAKFDQTNALRDLDIYQGLIARDKYSKTEAIIDGMSAWAEELGIKKLSGADINSGKGYGGLLKTTAQMMAKGQANKLTGEGKEVAKKFYEVAQDKVSKLGKATKKTSDFVRAIKTDADEILKVLKESKDKFLEAEDPEIFAESLERTSLRKFKKKANRDTVFEVIKHWGDELADKLAKSGADSKVVEALRSHAKNFYSSSKPSSEDTSLGTLKELAEIISGSKKSSKKYGDVKKAFNEIAKERADYFNKKLLEDEVVSKRSLVLAAERAMETNSDDPISGLLHSLKGLNASQVEALEEFLKARFVAKEDPLTKEVLSRNVGVGDPKSLREFKKRIGIDSPRVNRLYADAQKVFAGLEGETSVADIWDYVAERMPFGTGEKNSFGKANAITSRKDVDSAISRLGNKADGLPEDFKLKPLKEKVESYAKLSDEDIQHNREQAVRMFDEAVNSPRGEFVNRTGEYLQEVEEGGEKIANELGRVSNVTDDMGKAIGTESNVAFSSDAVYDFNRLPLDVRNQAVKDWLEAIKPSLAEKGANKNLEKGKLWQDRIENFHDIVADADLGVHGSEAMRSRLNTDKSNYREDFGRIEERPSVKNRSGYNFIDATDVLSARVKDLDSEQLLDRLYSTLDEFSDDIAMGEYVDEAKIAPLIKEVISASEEAATTTEGKLTHKKFMKELEDVGIHLDDLDNMERDLAKAEADEIVPGAGYAKNRYEDDPDVGIEEDLLNYIDKQSSPEAYLPGRFYKTMHLERDAGFDELLPITTQSAIAKERSGARVLAEKESRAKKIAAVEKERDAAVAELKKEISGKGTFYKTSPEQAKEALDEIRALGKKIEAITSSSGFKASQKRLEDATEAYNRVLSGEGASAYTNRFGTTFLADANDLNGYSEARSILDVSVAQNTREGFHPIENRRIRKENRQLKSIGEKSFNERLSTYGYLKDSIKKNVDPALGDIADEDILASHGWAQMMAVSNSEFSKSQGVYQAMMKLAGFNKSIQSLQLAGGISYLNAFTFRQALSALMTDPGSLPTFIKSFFDARSSRSVADFFRANQDRITEVTLSTGDPFYMDSLIDMVSKDRGYSTNVTQDIIDSWKDNKYDVVMKRTPKENGKLKAGEPMYDVTTSQAVESGKISRLAESIKNTVDRVFEEPTFKRYIPVLQTAMYLRNLDRAHWALRSALNIPVGKPLEDRETDLVVKLAHARTKLFWHPIKTVGNAKNLLIPKKSGAMSADMAVRANYESMIDDYVARGGKLSSKQVLTSFFFALDYKATMMGRMLNGLQGFARPHNFVYGGARKDVMAMMGVIGAAVLWNAQNGYETAFDNPDKLLSNLNNLGKFRLGDDKGSAVIDPFFSQFTLVNSAMRGTRGMLGYEGGTDTGNMNAQRGTRFKIGNWHIGDFGPLNPISDEMATNLLNPYKSVYELFTNNTFFGNNIYEHPTLPNGQPNPNYNLYRNIGASIQHLLNFDTTNEWVKGANTIGDKTGQVGGSGLVQHPFMEAYKAWKNGDYGAALFKVMEMPLKYENLAGEARTSLNTYVLKGISQQKEVYDQVVRENPGNKEKIDKAYGEYVKNSIRLISDWNDKWKAFKKDPKLLAAANNILVGFFSGEYDDNLKKMQTAYWKASVDSQMGGDFGFDKKENETEEQYVERKNKSYEFYAKQLDKEYEARQTLKKYGWKVEYKAFEDAEIEYKNTNKAVAAQVDAVLNGKIAGFKNFAEMKANYESRIKNLDNLYDVFDAKSAKKLREKKAALAEEYNKQLFDALIPFVDKYGVDILNYPANKGGFMETEISKLVLVPANKFYNGKDPQKSYLKDQFGVGYRNNTALPSDAEVQKRFLQVQNILKAGRFAQANSKLDSLIEDIRKGRVGVAGRDWAKIVHYKALFDSKSY